ncbi:MAG: hypothetical protein ACRD3M_10405 [Thermoanaerobaculia bacterium]
MKSLRRGIAAAGLLCGVALLSGCAEKGDPAREALDRIVKAARERDASAVVAQLANDYRDASANARADVEQMLRGYFAAYEIVDVALHDVTVERAEGAALARFRADLSGQPRQAAGVAGLLPSSASYRFEVRLAPEGPRWKVAWASWEPDSGQ